MRSPVSPFGCAQRKDLLFATCGGVGVANGKQDPTRIGMRRQRIAGCDDLFLDPDTLLFLAGPARAPPAVESGMSQSSVGPHPTLNSMRRPTLGSWPADSDERRLIRDEHLGLSPVSYLEEPASSTE